MIVRIELAIVVDEKMKVIKNARIKGEIETITELKTAVEEYKKLFLATNPQLTCNVIAIAKLAIEV